MTVRASLYFGFLSAFLSAIGCDRPTESAVDSPVKEKAALRKFWDLHDRAHGLYAAGDFAQAEGIYRQVLRLDPRHPASLYNLAYIQFRLGRGEESLALLKTLLEVDPHETKALLLEAIVLSTPRPGSPFDPKRAMAILERALKLNSEESGPFLLQGRAALLAGDSAKAAERLDLAIRSNPLASEAMNLLGVLALRRGDPNDASKHFERALKAAQGAPPAAGLPGEGDTVRGGVGYHRLQALQARWLQSLSLPLEQVPTLETPARPLPCSMARSGRAIAAGDFDADGDADLAVGSLTGPVQVFSFVDGKLEAAASLDVAGISFLAAGDLDGRPPDDLYALRGSGFTLEEPLLLFARKEFRFEAFSAPGGKRRSLAAAVLKTDRGPEVVEVGPAEGSLGAVRVLRLDGGTWKLSLVDGVPGTTCALDVVALPGPRGAQDAPDVAVSFAHHPPCLLRRGSDGLRTVLPAEGLEGLGVVEALAAVALDGDAWVDLAGIASSDVSESLSFLAEGKGNKPPVRLLVRKEKDRFEPAGLALPVFASTASALKAGDIDGDGKDDLLVLGGGPEPWRIEPWWALLRRGEGFVLMRGSYPSGTVSASGAVFHSVGGSGGFGLVIAGGGLLPLDQGKVFALQIAPAAGEGVHR